MASVNKITGKNSLFTTPCKWFLFLLFEEKKRKKKSCNDLKYNEYQWIWYRGREASANKKNWSNNGKKWNKKHCESVSK